VAGQARGGVGADQRPIARGDRGQERVDQAVVAVAVVGRDVVGHGVDGLDPGAEINVPHPRAVAVEVTVCAEDPGLPLLERRERGHRERDRAASGELHRDHPMIDGIVVPVVDALAVGAVPQRLHQIPAGHGGHRPPPARR
jgi:hypothetical protein